MKSGQHEPLGGGEAVVRYKLYLSSSESPILKSLKSHWS